MEFIIAPREICASCNTHSGPKFHLSQLSDFSNILRENTIPTGQAREMVERDISSAQSEISALDIEIERLQESLDNLISRRDALQRVVVQSKGVFSPIRKLPPELLRRIFHLAQPRSQAIFADSYHPNNFIRTASQVSYYWSCISHSCALLWSNICARMISDIPAPLVSSFIERCITLSKEVSLRLELGHSCTPESLGESCVAMIAQSAQRWEHVHIQEENLLRAIDAKISVDTEFTQLQSLNISHNSGSFVLKPAPKLATFTLQQWNNNDNPHSFSFSSVPYLTHVKLTGVSFPLTNLHHFPWSQISDIDLEYNRFSQGEFYRLLQHMSNLTSLSLKGDTNMDWPIVLPNLRALKLHGSNHHANLFGNLTAPLLKTLHLYDPFDSSSIVNFLQRCGCALEELVVHRMQMDEMWTDIPELLSIRKLRWVDPPISTVSSGILSLVDQFPQLETLHVEKLKFRRTTWDNENMRPLTKDVIIMLATRLSTAGLEGRLVESSSSYASGRSLMKVAKFEFDMNLTEEEIFDLEEFIELDMVRHSGVKMIITDCNTFDDSRSLF